MSAVYDPYGPTVPGLSYKPAFERASRLTAIFVKRTGLDPKMKPVHRFWEFVWDRTAADLEGAKRPWRHQSLQQVLFE